MGRNDAMLELLREALEDTPEAFPVVERLVKSLSTAKGNESAMALIAQEWAAKWFVSQDELSKTRAMLSSAQSQIAAMTKYIRTVGGHCGGCLHFRGMRGCAISKMDECGLDNDFYLSKFIG